MPHVVVKRTFEFTDQSRYESLDLTSAQTERIAAYYGEIIPVHYMLYNPGTVPWSVTVPSARAKRLPRSRVGCRVIRSTDLLSLQNQGISVPTYGSVAAIPAPHAVAPFLGGWRLEDFVVTLLIGCYEGKVLSESLDSAMELLFYRRTGPIAAAFPVNIEIGDHSN